MYLQRRSKEKKNKKKMILEPAVKLMQRLIYTASTNHKAPLRPTFMHSGRKTLKDSVGPITKLLTSLAWHSSNQSTTDRQVSAIDFTNQLLYWFASSNI